MIVAVLFHSIGRAFLSTLRWVASVTFRVTLRLRGDPHGRDVSVRKVVAAGVATWSKLHASRSPRRGARRWQQRSD